MALRKRAFIILAFLAAGAGLAASRLPLKLPTTCIFRRVTGLPCCSCGMTHAFCAMAHGQFVQAATFNPAAIPLALLVLVAAVLVVGELIWQKPLLNPAWKKFSPYIVRLGAPILLLSWAFELYRVIWLHGAVA